MVPEAPVMAIRLLTRDMAMTRIFKSSMGNGRAAKWLEVNWSDELWLPGELPGHLQGQNPPTG